jgi:hypothetical protein
MSGRLAKEGLGGSADAGASDDEEEHLVNPEMDSMVTLVGNVRDRPVFILDDMMDKPASWIAAAETVVKRGGATHVICIATHGRSFPSLDLSCSHAAWLCSRCDSTSPQHIPPTYHPN